MTDHHSTSARSSVVIAMLLIGCLAWRSAPGNNIPERLSLDAAEPWMADALPGVGAKSKERVAEWLRTRQLEKIPARARAMVPQLFNEVRDGD